MTSPDGGGTAAAPVAPLVSVITIFLNAERFLEEAIQSVLAQTYGHWELLLVDDGSTDGSTAIARAHAARDPARVRYLQHPAHANRGMSASRNLGLREARGEYVAFLDADDVYRAEKLERQVALLEAHPEAAMVYGATTHWYSWAGAGIGPDVPRRLGVPPDTLVDPPELLVRYLRGMAQTPGTCGVLVRRGIARQLGGFDETFRGMYEDQVFFSKICLESRVFVESGQWDLYRQHAGAHTRRMDAQGEWSRAGDPNAATHRFLDWLAAHVASRARTVAPARHPRLARAIAAARWPYRHPLLAAAVRPLASRWKSVWRRLRQIWYRTTTEAPA